MIVRNLSIHLVCSVVPTDQPERFRWNRLHTDSSSCSNR